MPENTEITEIFPIPQGILIPRLPPSDISHLWERWPIVEGTTPPYCTAPYPGSSIGVGVGVSANTYLLELVDVLSTGMHCSFTRLMNFIPILQKGKLSYSAIK